jgi:hypothetical protein
MHVSHLDDLRAKARQRSEYSKVPDTVELDSAVPDSQVLDGLKRYFGEDDEREAIMLVVDGEEIGYLLRSDLYHYQGPAFRSIATGQHATLPGVSFDLLQLRCPVYGCRYSPLVMLFDEDDPPRCKVHPDTAMEIAP